MHAPDPRQFRFLTAIGATLWILSLILELAGIPSLSEDEQILMEWRFHRGLVPESLAQALLWFARILYLVGLAGFLFLQPWSRKLFLFGTILLFAVAPLFGWEMYPPAVHALGRLGAALLLAALVLSHFEPYARLFTQEPTRETTDHLPPLLYPNVAHAEGGPWGLWPTLGLSALILLGFIVAQTIGAGLYAAIQAGFGEGLRSIEVDMLMNDPGMLAAVSICSAPVLILGCIAAAKFRHGIELRDYLGLEWFSLKRLLSWIGLALLMEAAVMAALSGMEGGESEKFMREIMGENGPSPALWFALVIAAPISEEIFFRGFLFKGLHASLGAAAAVLITALSFMAIHLQYDAQGLLAIAGTGIFLGLARLKTGSVYLCMALHAFLNALSTLLFWLTEQ